MYLVKNTTTRKGFCAIISKKTFTNQAEMCYNIQNRVLNDEFQMIFRRFSEKRGYVPGGTGGKKGYKMAGGYK